MRRWLRRQWKPTRAEAAPLIAEMRAEGARQRAEWSAR